MTIAELAHQNAQEMLSYYGKKLGGDKFSALATALEVDVLYCGWLAPLYSVISKDAGKRAAVVINSSKPKNVQRYMLAHSLGHALERSRSEHGERYSFQECVPGEPVSVHEAYAEQFAREFLMPQAKVKMLKDNGLSLTEMTSLFQVDLDTLTRWMEEIGALK